MASASCMSAVSVSSRTSRAGSSPLKVERVLDVVDEAVAVELTGRHVDRHGEVLPRPAPRRALPAGLVQHPGPDRHDQAARLEGGEELVGRDHAALGVTPPQEGLDPGEVCRWPGRTSAGRRGRTRRASSAGPQVDLEVAVVVDGGLHRRHEAHGASLALRLGLVEGDVGVLEQFVGRVPVALGDSRCWRSPRPGRRWRTAARVWPARRGSARPPWPHRRRRRQRWRPRSAPRTRRRRGVRRCRPRGWRPGAGRPP